MRRRTVLVAAAAALVVGLTGCGIPDQTEVRDIGPGPEPGYATGGGTGAGPPARSAATTMQGFVTNFLAAVGGEPSKRQDRVRQYIAQNVREKVNDDPDAGINVVRLREAPTFTAAGQGSWKVTLKVDQVGVLDTKGSLGLPVLNKTSYTFTIAGVEGTNEWYVTEPPGDLLLSTEALSNYYLPRTLYFWSRDRGTLVPDGRYMPSDLEEERQPTRIVDWLVEGPSEWIQGAVSPLNAGTESKQNVPYPKDRLEVAFNAVVAERTDTTRDVDVVVQLGQQLMWSLRPYVTSELALRIDGQGEQVFTKDQAFYRANAAHREFQGPEQEDEMPERFAIFQSKIHRLRGSPDGGTRPLPQLLLAGGVNENIVSATLAREANERGLLTGAALVTQQGEDYRLRVATAVGDGASPPVTSRAFGSMKRAVWLKSPMEVGLVLADRSLYRFTEGSPELERVGMGGFDGMIADVSAAPDGRRIAILVNGTVYVVGVSRQELTVQAAGPHRRVPTPLRSVSAVDWSEESKIVVAGRGHDDKEAVWEVSLDGGLAEQQQVGDPGGSVQHLVAYPDDPVVASPTKVMFSRSGAAFDVDGGNSSIEPSEVMGASGEVVASQVTAPFFLLD